MASVSYLVASYNHSKFIEKTLNSFVEDGIPDREIVVIDDGSTDDSPQIIERWIQAHHQEKVTFHKQENKGVGATLNKLISLARNEFLRPCASDDRILAGSTKLLMEALNAQPEKVAIFADGKVINDADKIISDSIFDFLGSRRENYQRNLFRALITRWAVAGPVILWRKTKLPPQLYDERLIVEDWFVYLRLLAKNQITYLDVPVALYRVHGENTSFTINKKKRLQNLSSQIAAGEANLSHFHGKWQLFLKSEIALLKAKKHFLSKNFIKMVFNLAGFVWWKLQGKAAPH